MQICARERKLAKSYYVLVRIKIAERASMNDIDVEPRLALNEILSDFRGKLLIAGRLNEKVPRPVFRRFAGAAPRAHFTHPRVPNRNCLPNERTRETLRKY